MPRYIIQLEDYYLEWSTVVDAPVTYGMTLDEFREYYHQVYGSHGMASLDERLERVKQKGTSAFVCDSVYDVIAGNRAGHNETEMTREQIIEWYCVKKLDPYEHAEAMGKKMV